MRMTGIHPPELAIWVRADVDSTPRDSECGHPIHSYPRGVQRIGLRASSALVAKSFEGLFQFLHALYQRGELVDLTINSAGENMRPARECQATFGNLGDKNGIPITQSSRARAPYHWLMPKRAHGTLIA
jgi:hypothetical protein